MVATISELKKPLPQHFMGHLKKPSCLLILLNEVLDVFHLSLPVFKGQESVLHFTKYLETVRVPNLLNGCLLYQQMYI